MTTVTELAADSTDGSRVGSAATSKVAFYGAAPVVQPSATAQSALSTTAITTLATTPTATDIAVAMNSVIASNSAVVTLVNRLRADLVTLGLIKGSA